MKNVRINTDQRFNLSLKAGGASIDMTSIDVLSLYMYCNPQKARDGAIKHSVSTSDTNVLEMIWPADVQRYLGSHSVHGTIRYAGAVASFDVPAVNVVSLTSEADISTDTIVIDAPVGTEDLTATITIQGIGPQGPKGPKGDKMTYADLTESDKADLYEGGASLIKPLLATKQNVLTDTDGGYGQRVAELEKEGIASEEKLTELDLKTGEMRNSIQDLDGDTLYITDSKGNIIAKIGQNGIESTEVSAKGVKLSKQQNLDSIIPDLYQNKLFISDKNGNVLASFAKDGFHAINILGNAWHGKVIATYGDSVTALNGGDYEPKSNDTTDFKWARKVAKYFSFKRLNNRGIGSTTFMYPSNGGMIAWVDKITGEYINRDDNHTYKDYEDNPSFIPTGTDYVGSRAYDSTKHNLIRGCGCSWLRITSMFKPQFKDDIDVVLVMYHNDFHQDMDTDATWVENSVVDKEWAASEYYNTYNGDYNIDSVKGGIASVVMKLQAWMPNALIVLMTPISGIYIGGYDNVRDLENPESAKMKKLAEIVKDVSFRMSIPCIDVYGTDGINSLNKKNRNYITDGIHPYSDAGCKVIARAIISKMISIIPNL